MKRFAFVGLVFALNLFLSNVCLLGTAYAAEDVPTGPALSREVPMSFNVVRCSWTKTADGWEPTPGSPCASGHCLEKEKPDDRCLFADVVPHAPAQVPPSFVAEAFAIDPSHVLATAPFETPPPYPGFASTVLRM